MRKLEITNYEYIKLIIQYNPDYEDYLNFLRCVWRQ
mgnify:CR=1 FL=1